MDVSYFVSTRSESMTSDTRRRLVREVESLAKYVMNFAVMLVQKRAEDLAS
jgi:hypothetical protein